MVKFFIALIGKAESGKTTELDRLVVETWGIQIKDLSNRMKIAGKPIVIDNKRETRQSKFFVCKIKGKTVFVVDSSPQERGGNEKVIPTLKDDLKFIEKVAKIFGISNYVVVSAFTMPKSKKRWKMKITDAKKEIEKQNFTFRELEQIYGTPLLPRVKKHEFFQ